LIMIRLGEFKGNAVRRCDGGGVEGTCDDYCLNIVAFDYLFLVGVEAWGCAVLGATLRLAAKTHLGR
jgi:hypothetical protein